MNFEYSALSDVGRHRANNEDAVMVDPARGIVVLADGMGGYNAGEVASALAVDLIAGELGRWLEEAATVASTRDVRRAMERWKSASTTPTDPSSTPLTRTKPTPAWARRWSWVCCTRACS